MFFLFEKSIPLFLLVLAIKNINNCLFLKAAKSNILLILQI